MMNSSIKTNARFRWLKLFRRRPQLHNPMLVFNMSIFNFDGGWSRIFNPLKTHESGTS